ncbi:LysR substrate-binding domain-containing protein [Glacieibacterium frigidum]|uniref:LysR substrate-binding domain-containing protein n=1 Tax=Glacieibacterium frigidum TaxID=2593303 RepID=UPI001A9C49B9|nr:LysR substrate-binding domain-containing protein [Glacieibacterium frigidum]
MRQNTSRPVRRISIASGHRGRSTTPAVALAFDVVVRGAKIYTAAGLAGLGLIQVPRCRVEHRIRSGELVPVLEHQPPAPMPIHVLYPASRNLAPRVRTLGDWLARLFETAQAAGRI